MNMNIVPTLNMTVKSYGTRYLFHRDAPWLNASCLLGGCMGGESYFLYTKNGESDTTGKSAAGVHASPIS